MGLCLASGEGTHLLQKYVSRKHIFSNVNLFLLG